MEAANSIAISMRMVPTQTPGDTARSIIPSLLSLHIDHVQLKKTLHYGKDTYVAGKSARAPLWGDCKRNFLLGGCFAACSRDFYDRCMKRDFPLPVPEEVESLCREYMEQCAGSPAKEVERSPEATPLSALDELMAMTGIENVKEAVMRQLSFHKIMARRAKRGLKTPPRLLHMILTGSPGTGKTTVARLIGRLYREAGILTSDTFVECNRATLVGRYIGETEANTRAKVREAAGGTLFIDEIYSLTESPDDSGRDFGQKVIDTLLPVLSSENGMMVVGAGYADKINLFLRANPGLNSRFPIVLDFNDFSVDELLAISVKRLRDYDFSLSPEAGEKLRELLSAIVATVADHGNARMAISLCDRILERLCQRAEADSLPDDDLGTVVPADIPSSVEEVFPIQQRRRQSIGFCN